MATAGIEKLFRSARLIYRAVEDDQEDKNFMYKIQSDVAALASSDSDLLKPMTTKEANSHHAYVSSRTLLGVIICLPNPERTSIGSLYLTAPKPGAEHHRNSYISIDIIADYQRKGYGSEAIEWALNWGFKIAGLHRIGIEAFSYNEGARQLYERLGFVYEGCKRELLWFNGDWHDYLSWSMLEHEWRALIEKKSLANAKEVKKE
ncbi:Acyl-CoA N-acyltransferases (Nat) [Glarea lozoyensis ATCC 20868]|uniref:Acyl-CoA N-acyltransferases (Nat) n=1 Tax=Glarea lozoyensis (strain ATCC 20868 / MF5171) TaxID=1116229 RepID=S3CKQ8_GLAL2|nr:Acyl-CoA N-acyltransferases (Nat) [Glarea lozoyensis ATCC 20868]EPE26320.1 Acyl-CoA N-acyltransferases (Nat) [Glarea lozoyensis ATCC 20868]